nr:hypothetical protein GCM10020092_004560 [Actinoplanes digitatis]
MALNLVTGRQAWRTATTIPLGSLVVDQGTAVVSGASASDTPAVIGIRASDGAERWSLDDFRSSGVSAGGRVLVGSTTGVETRAVSAATGGTLWSRPTAWTAEAATPAGDRFYASGAEGALICVGAGDGAVLWTAAKGASTLVAADGRRVYRAVTNGIEALNARTGSASLDGAPRRRHRAAGPGRRAAVHGGRRGGKPLGIVNAASGVVASPGSQIGSLDRGNVVVTAGWIYLTRGNTIFGYAR